MVAAAPKASTVRFQGCAFLRNRLVLATLSGRTVRFDGIRKDDDEAPGLSPAEISFIRLLDKITNGSAIEINETGTTLRYRPGVLVGHSSSRLSHMCHPSRSLSYYLEPLMMLAPFCKRPLNIELQGPTHSMSDACIDSLANVSVPLLRRLTLGTPVEPDIQVVKRAVCCSASVYDGGAGGLVRFRCGILAGRMAPVDLIELGLVKRIRGLAFANRVSPSHISGMVDSVRGALNRFTPDVYVHTDHSNSTSCGAGFGVHLMAETTEGCLVGADWTANAKETTAKSVAEQAVSLLLEQISHGGCVDGQNTCLALLMCALSDSDVSRLRIGHIQDSTVVFLRDLREMFGVVFKITESAGDDIQLEENVVHDSDHSSDLDEATIPIGSGILVSCVGVGLANSARQRF